MDTLGGPGAAIIVGLENVFPPIPSEVILPLAGFSAAQGTFSVVAAVLWTTLGSVVGAVVAYGLGFWLGAERVRALFGSRTVSSVTWRSTPGTSTGTAGWSAGRASGGT